MLKSDNMSACLVNPHFQRVQMTFNTDTLTATDVVRNHLLPNVICSGILDGNLLTINLLNDYLRVTSDDNKLFIEGAQVLDADIMATNGVVHVVDQIIVPTRGMSRA